MSASKINKDTLVPVSLVAGIVITIASGAVWINNKLQSLSFSVEALRVQIKTVESKLDSVNEDRWTARDMKLWTQILKAKNPNMEVPDLGK